MLTRTTEPPCVTQVDILFLPLPPSNFDRRSEFDQNDDGRLELSELRRLCDLVGRGNLSDEELKQAIALLSSRDKTHIYFTDFAGGGGGCW